MWSEFVAYDELASDRVLGMLRSRNLQPLIAVRPENISTLPSLVQRLREAELCFGLWPMLDDSDGRWANAFSAPNFAEFTRELIALVGAVPSGTVLAIDLEPPIDLLRQMLRGEWQAFAALSRRQRHRGEDILRELVDEASAIGYCCVAAVTPLLLCDTPERRAWQRLLGTPVETLAFEALSCMSYTSLFEGYSRGVLHRRASLAMLAQSAAASHKRFGKRAALSIGSVGGGALGDERPYRGLHELVEDVAVARACGIEDLSLFDLAGVLAQEHPEAWLDAFVDTAPLQGPLPSSRRSRILERSAMELGVLLTRNLPTP